VDSFSWILHLNLAHLPARLLLRAKDCSADDVFANASPSTTYQLIMQELLRWLKLSVREFEIGAQVFERSRWNAYCFTVVVE
jgi:hypothetical protein